MCIHLTAGAQKGQKVSHPLKLELQVIGEPSNVNAGNQTQALCKGRRCSSPLDYFCSPLVSRHRDFKLSAGTQ